MSATQASLHFNIDGGYIADLARNFVREGNWERGLKLLTEDLEGMSHELAIRILNGEADLTGSSDTKDGIGFKDLPVDGPIAVSMCNQLAFLYGRTFRYKERYWRAYARVTSWGPEDNRFKEDGSTLNILIEGEYSAKAVAGAKRSLYYANRPLDDMLVAFTLNGHDGVDILCEEASMPPLWHDVPVNLPIETLKAWHAKGMDLEERGYCVSEGDSSSLAKPRLVISRDAQEADLEDAEGFTDTVTPELSNEEIGERVREQAKTQGGFMRLELTSKDESASEGFVDVARNPFILWALRHFDFEAFGKVRPVWTPISPKGIKMSQDDPNHTDWMLGAGLDLKQAYDREEDTHTSRAMAAASKACYRLTREWTASSFVILAKGKKKRFNGEIVVARPHELVPAGSIALAPAASPKYQLAMQSACQADKYGNPGLIICETGGQLAHLAIVGREFECTVLMIPGAIAKFRSAHSVSVDLDTGLIYPVL